MMNEKPPYVGAARNRLVSVITRELEAARTTASPVGPRSSAWTNGSISQHFSNRRLSPKGVLPPWRLSGFIETGPVFKIFVRPGMVNNFVPTIGGVSLAAATPPSLTVTGSQGVIYLKATLDAATSITALVIESATTVPADTNSAPINKYKLIGSWTVSGGAFTSVMGILNTNQTLRICNGAAEWY